MKPRVGRTPDILRKGGPMTDRKKEAVRRSRRKFATAYKELSEWEDDDDDEDLSLPAQDTSVPATTKDKSSKD